MIIGWVILNVTMNRERWFEKHFDSEVIRLVAHLDQIRQLESFRKESLDLTFDMHTLQIESLKLRVLGSNDPSAMPPLEVAAISEDIERRMRKSTVTEDSTKIISELSSYESRYHARRKRYRSWISFMWKLEVILVIWGTGQWAYGDLFATWFQSYCDIAPV